MTPGEVAALAAKIDSLHETVLEVKALATATNGRVREIELWKARLQGAKMAVGWIPPLVTAVVASGFSVLLYALFLTH